MSTDPSKPSSSSRRPSGSSRRDHDRNRQRTKYEDRDSHRTRDHNRERHRRRTRSLSPVAAPSKHARTAGSRKGKEPVRNDVEVGEIEEETKTKTYNIGDDFIRFEVSDAENSGEEVRRSDKGKAPERDWDKGKPPRYDDDHHRRGTKRKHDDLSDTDDREPRRAAWQVQSRIAPWVVNVDWGNCRNMAEVYVCPYSHLYRILKEYRQDALRSEGLCKLHVAHPRRRRDS